MENILNYKGHPVVRSKNQIYFGSFENKYIIVIKILETKMENDLEVATKLNIELQLNDPEISDMDKIKKTAQRTSLFEAMDIAEIWLRKAISNK